MRGVYTAHIEIASLAAAKTVLLMELPATNCVEILSAQVTNANVNTAEQHTCGLFRVTTKGAPAGAAVNIQKKESGSAATIVTWLGDLTTEPTTYDAAPLEKGGVNNIGGYYYDPIPEERDIVPPSKLVGLRLLNTPVTPFKAICIIKYREIG